MGGGRLPPPLNPPLDLTSHYSTTYCSCNHGFESHCMLNSSAFARRQHLLVEGHSTDSAVTQPNLRRLETRKQRFSQIVLVVYAREVSELKKKENCSDDWWLVRN